MGEGRNPHAIIGTPNARRIIGPIRGPRRRKCFMAENPYESPKHPAHDVAQAPSTEQAFDQALWDIRKEATNAVVCGVIAFVLGIIFAPLAIMCGRKALRMIQEHDQGHEYEARARLGIKLGYIGLGLFVSFFFLMIGIAFILVMFGS
jgi:hypothetical protein